MLKLPSSVDAPTRRFLVVGRESVGKSQLVESLTGQESGTANWGGTTTEVRGFALDDAVLVDTPGIFRDSDSETTRRTLGAMNSGDAVILVVQATQIDEDLRLLLPLVSGRSGVVVVTFWDKVYPGVEAVDALERVAREAGVPFVPLDARRVDEAGRHRTMTALADPGVFRDGPLAARIGWRIEPAPGWLDHPRWGPAIAAVLVLLPALATVFGANRVADVLHPRVDALVAPAIALVDTHAPEWLRVVLTASQGEFGYGILNMGPFLLVWALPTVLLFALVLGSYKASGLMDRVNVALHRWAQPFGLSGRAVTRVMMGFGCNVPAVISTRSCSSCSRETAVAAIAFGSACSYQLPATLAVLATAGSTGSPPEVLALVYLGYLLLTTMVFLRLSSPAEARSPLNVLVGPPRPFMQWPPARALRREAAGVIRQFLLQALPIFVAICVVASVMARSGVLDAVSGAVGPAMGIFRLPAEAALPVVLASVRKDGIMLFAMDGELAFPMTPVQLLTGVYLAGVLLPCLVTALTIGRELSWVRAGAILGRQAAFAVGFAALLAWAGPWVLS